MEVAVHATNRGHIATYNEGLLEWADGDYSVLMSADDRLTPGALRRATDLLDAHPGVGFVYGHRAVLQGRRATADGSDQSAGLVGVAWPVVARAPIPSTPQLHYVAGSRRAHIAPEARGRI